MASILIVDDEESIRFTYKRFLTDAGYDVAVASHFIEAKSLLPANEFEVAIVDRVLGESNGIELVKHIKEVQPFCEPILISGFPSFKSASETLQYDVFAYLTKPILKKKLCQTVDGAVKKNRIKKESHHNERILQSLFDSSPDAIVISDLSKKTRFVNPAFTRIFGYSKKELIGSFIPYVPEWDKEKTESDFRTGNVPHPIIEQIELLAEEESQLTEAESIRPPDAAQPSRATLSGNLSVNTKGSPPSPLAKTVIVAAIMVSPSVAVI